MLLSAESHPVGPVPADKTIGEFLGHDGADRFTLGRELHGAFGGLFGGVLAAAALVAARPLAPGRVPAALDCHFVRGVPAGTLRAVASVLHAGRTLAVVNVDLLDERERLGTRATVTLVDPAGLRPLAHAGVAARVPWPAHADGAGWRAPEGVKAPIIETLAPRALAIGDDGIVTSVRVPWDADNSSAEACCLAADMCVGPPVGGAFPGQWVPHPNPDLSLRFAGDVTGREVAAAGRLERVAGGVALVGIEVRSGHDVVAVGTSCSLLLA